MAEGMSQWTDFVRAPQALRAGGLDEGRASSVPISGRDPFVPVGPEPAPLCNSFRNRPICIELPERPIAFSYIELRAILALWAGDVFDPDLDHRGAGRPYKQGETRGSAYSQLELDPSPGKNVMQRNEPERRWMSLPPPTA